jgi:hypothetical protein
MNATHTPILRAPVEQLYADELKRLAERDTAPKPVNWRLSPRAVRSFVLGDDKLQVSRKFFGDDPLVDADE